MQHHTTAPVHLCLHLVGTDTRSPIESQPETDHASSLHTQELVQQQQHAAEAAMQAQPAPQQVQSEPLPSPSLQQESDTASDSQQETALSQHPAVDGQLYHHQPTTPQQDQHLAMHQHASTQDVHHFGDDLHHSVDSDDLLAPQQHSTAQPRLQSSVLHNHGMPTDEGSKPVAVYTSAVTGAGLPELLLELERKVICFAVTVSDAVALKPVGTRQPALLLARN